MTRRGAHRIAAAVALGATIAPGCGRAPQIALYSDHLYLDTSRVPCGDGHATVEILQQPPDRVFTRVAYLEAFTSFVAQQEITWDDLRLAICRQAIEVGADAIIDLTVGSRPYSRGLQVGPLEATTGGVVKRLTGVAIRYQMAPPTSDTRDPSARP